MQYEGKVAVVTGAASGIGAEIVRELGRRSANVVVSDYDKDGAERVAQQIVAAGGSATAFRCDIGSDDDVAAMGKFVLDCFGRIDILMNHAGVGAGGPADRVPLEDWRWVFEINILGIARTLGAFLPKMTEQRSGLIVNTSSSLALFPEIPFVIPYISSKAAVLGLTEALALYCEPLGIQVMALVPDMTETNFHRSNRITGLDDDKLRKLLPMSQIQSPADVANAFFDAAEKGLFMACNVPNLEAELLKKARARYQPDFRVFPQIRDNMAKHWPVQV